MTSTSTTVYGKSVVIAEQSNICKRLSSQQQENEPNAWANTLHHGKLDQYRRTVTVPL